VYADILAKGLEEALLALSLFFWRDYFPLLAIAGPFHRRASFSMLLFALFSFGMQCLVGHCLSQAFVGERARHLFLSCTYLPMLFAVPCYVVAMFVMRGTTKAGTSHKGKACEGRLCVKRNPDESRLGAKNYVFDKSIA
jgi:hypothetical protein